MRALTCFTFIALACATQGDTSSQIIGGKNVPIAKYPFQVSIKYSGQHICSGSIINNRNILTSARCIYRLENLRDNLKIHAGTLWLDIPGAVYDVIDVRIHEKFDEITNDIAVIYLQTPIRYSMLIQSINLLTNDVNLEGKSCMLAGWGHTEIGGDISNNLKEIETTVSSQKECNEISSATNITICTLIKPGLGGCDGDRGGPLIIGGTQIGIVSSYSCGIKKLDVHTKVSSFISWIITNLNN
ncbi:hypothetical protein PUN28_006311 [Cardiocondyla obscurior]|uniref:Peptidase S1 domain-containing protein n=1 Tax=Cardiocondyla obscurior TaxID=286306 RepID=A0AAW2G840_9HYME